MLFIGVNGIRSVRRFSFGPGHVWPEVRLFGTGRILGILGHISEPFRNQPNEPRPNVSR